MSMALVAPKMLLQIAARDIGQMTDIQPLCRSPTTPGQVTRPPDARRRYHDRKVYRLRRLR
jgi:hypothetical protein